MKSIDLGLFDSVTSSYDQTKTSLIGRVTQKTISSRPCLGPPQNVFFDVVQDSTITPNLIYVTDNGRLFVVSTITAGVGSVLLYDFDLSTGIKTYRGRIQFVLPNVASTVHTVRGFKVLDNPTNTGWDIYIGSSASVAINGGLFVLNNIDKTDFVFSSFPTIPFATGADQKAVYFLQNSTNLGVSNTLMNACTGLILDNVGNRIYFHNGVSATHQYHHTSVPSSPDCPGITFTITIAVPGVLTATAHGFAINDPVFISTTGALPTGLTNNTVYFARNVTANTLELSATTGGASITTTGSQSGTHTIRRAFGTSSNTYIVTGNLPALTGTLLNTNSEDYAFPSHSTNSGFACASFSTSSNLYFGKLSELTAGTTTWPSLATSNNNANPATQFTTITPTISQYSTVLDRFVLHVGSRFYLKQLVNNNVDLDFGFQSLSILQNLVTIPMLSAANFSGMEIRSGWLFALTTNASQIGIIACDIRSSRFFDYSYITTKVYNVSNESLKALCLQNFLPNTSNLYQVSYRISGFGSEIGGWSVLPDTLDLSGLGSQFIQFKIAFYLSRCPSALYAQLPQGYLISQPFSDLSDFWEFSFDNSSSLVPTRYAFRLKIAYTTSVPQLFFKAYDTTSPINSLLVDINTTAHATQFEYSTDDGVSWLPLGTIPNTIGTLIRVTPTVSPSVKTRPSLRES